ncbi:hypothetical protein PMI14_01395, partial [Acidovorax sp. CF316]
MRGAVGLALAAGRAGGAGVCAARIGGATPP